MVVTEEDEQTAAECRGCTERMYGPYALRDARRHAARTGHVVDVTRHEVVRHEDQDRIDRLRASSMVAMAYPARPTRQDQLTTEIIARSRKQTSGASRRAAWKRKQAQAGPPHRGAVPWPRGTCGHCLRDVSIRNDGRFRLHRDKDGSPCQGSGLEVPFKTGPPGAG